MKKNKVLLIEDDLFLLKLYSDKLKRAGFEVEKSASGEEGISKILLGKPDIIILDLILARKTGFEVLSEIKINPKIKKIPVIILTNLGQKADIEKGLSLGATAYLIKTDFSVNDLPRIIKENLAKK